jgi:metal-responsive CopG/Arc/MetJ family transcriptional regulator
MKRTLVSLPDELFDLMKTKLKGKFGENDSEIIRSIVIAYLSQQGYLKNQELPSEEELMTQHDIIGAMVDTLEEKGIITGNDIDNKVRKRLKSKKQLTKFEDLQ